LVVEKNEQIDGHQTHRDPDPIQRAALTHPEAEGKPQDDHVSETRGSASGIEIDSQFLNVITPSLEIGHESL